MTYVSNNLSLVEQHRPVSNEIADQTALFLAAGGKIQIPERVIQVKKPPKERCQPPNFQRSTVRAETSQQVARIRESAKTMTRREICIQEDISLGVLKGIASRNGIKFLIRGKNSCPPNKADPDLDALLVIQIKECIAKGINRQQCCLSVGISYSLLYRLIDDYGIDYPKLKPAFR
ncbi:hypothetical protein M1B34_31845 [Pseudomonas sp. MAFF 302030]|uniref:Uncharacterized protein n=1 Tax=Pseudomonas morbosilactucae TaxID=2938197 RepID=A0A9X2C9B4_9PSED|nr:hypothetical protein [Pseudomonas morbosilactucae]MCK9802131.1 hypothetical protein [Pseudomonas morbosilactucae]